MAASSLRSALPFPVETFVRESADDLTRGVLIAGSTESGKTNE